MSETSLHWCNYCATPFHSKRYLSQHQQRCKTCKRYRDVLFCCEKCGEFKTKGINNLHKHLESCTGDSITPPLPDIGTLEAQLAAEKVRSSIYLALLASHTNIDIGSILEKKDGNLHLFDVTPEMKIFLHDKVPAERPTPSKKIRSTPKQSRSYRRAPRAVESNPERSTQAISLVIDEIDKRKKQTLNQMDADSTSGIKHACQEIISQLASVRNYTKLLRQLKNERSKLLGTLGLQDYIQVVKDHTQEISEALANKQQPERKIRGNVLTSLTPLDARLIKYSGYHETQIDGEYREKLSAIIQHGRVFSKEFKPYVNEEMSQKLTTYSVAVFPIEKLIKWSLINPYGFWNVVYMAWPKSSDEDPYSFYSLDKIKKGKRYWNMNCRLEDFVGDLIECVQPYLIHMFRELYYTVFRDNDYRPNAPELSSFIAEDCEQLAQNIILVSQPRKLCDKLRKLLVENCTYKHTKQDHFSLVGDDVLQRKKFQTKEKIEMVDTVSQLFDDITDEQAVNFYKSRNIA